jgi:CMP-2-keto-3-deoxyoctulosonic acid synthetase
MDFDGGEQEDRQQCVNQVTRACEEAIKVASAPLVKMFCEAQECARQRYEQLQQLRQLEKNVRKSIASVCPREDNIEERSTLDAVNILILRAKGIKK